MIDRRVKNIRKVVGSANQKLTISAVFVFIKQLLAVPWFQTVIIVMRPTMNFFIGWHNKRRAARL